MSAAVSSRSDTSSSRVTDSGDRGSSARTAVAVGRVEIDHEIVEAIRQQRIPKGDVMQTSRTAALLGAKQATRLIPHCLDVSLDGIEVEMELQEQTPAIAIQAFAKSRGPTGVEMEALTAVTVAALTVYDMCKSISKDIQITGVHLVAKTGGQSGDYLRESAAQRDTY